MRPSMDDSVVVVIGSGAGGRVKKGRGARSGQRQSAQAFHNDEQLAWLDKRRTTSGTWRVAKDFPRGLDPPLVARGHGAGPRFATLSGTMRRPRLLIQMLVVRTCLTGR